MILAGRRLEIAINLTASDQKVENIKKLARAIGLSDHSRIYDWIKEGNIPENRIADIAKYFNVGSWFFWPANPINEQDFIRVIEDPSYAEKFIEKYSNNTSATRLSNQKHYLSEFPTPASFIGRKKNIQTLLKWNKDKNICIGSLIGLGGVGKTAIAQKFYETLIEGGLKKEQIFWRGLQNNNNLNIFLESLRSFLTQDKIDLSKDNGWEQIELIKNNARKDEYVIILDGFDAFQQPGINNFSKIIHHELIELFKFIINELKDKKGLLLITSRFPLNELKPWEKIGYQQLEIQDLNNTEGISLLKALGVKGERKLLETVVSKFNGHALALSIVSKYLVDLYEGDINAIQNIPRLFSDKTIGQELYQTLFEYQKLLTTEQLIFMSIFSLFTRNISNDDFENVFCTKMQNGYNQTLVDMSNFDFKKMVKNLQDKNLIYRIDKNSYSMQPLIKDYFSSTILLDEKLKCHEHIYRYIQSNAPKKPSSIEEMLPILDAVVQGSKAGLHDEVLDVVYWDILEHKREFYATVHQGAWNMVLKYIKLFFKDGDLSSLPLTKEPTGQFFMLAGAGVSLMCTGNRFDHVMKNLEQFENIEPKGIKYKNVIGGYINLARLQLSLGDIKKAQLSVEKAVKFAKEGNKEFYLIRAEGFLGFIKFLTGDLEEAETYLLETYKSQKDFARNGYSAVHLAHAYAVTGKTEEAIKVIEEHLKLSHENYWISDLSRSYKEFSFIERNNKKNLKQARIYVDKAIDYAEKTDDLELKLEAYIESAEEKLVAGKDDEAKQELKKVYEACESLGLGFHKLRADIVTTKILIAKKKINQAKELGSEILKIAKKNNSYWLEVQINKILADY